MGIRGLKKDTQKKNRKVKTALEKLATFDCDWCACFVGSVPKRKSSHALLHHVPLWLFFSVTSMQCKDSTSEQGLLTSYTPNELTDLKLWPLMFMFKYKKPKTKTKTWQQTELERGGRKQLFECQMKVFPRKHPSLKSTSTWINFVCVCRLHVAAPGVKRHKTLNTSSSSQQGARRHPEDLLFMFFLMFKETLWEVT